MIIKFCVQWKAVAGGIRRWRDSNSVSQGRFAQRFRAHFNCPHSTKFGSTVYATFSHIFANLCLLAKENIYRILKLSINYHPQCLTQESDVPVRLPVRRLTFVSYSADSGRAVVGYWRKYSYTVPNSRILVVNTGLFL